MGKHETNPKESVMSKVTTKKAATRKAQPKKTSAWVRDQPEVTPIPKRARGAAKFAEATNRRPVPQPPVTKGKLEVFDALMAPIVGKSNGKRVSGPPIPVVAEVKRHPNGKRIPDPVVVINPIATMTAPDRLKAAKAEHEAMKAWAAKGKKGEPPATPVLAWLGENPSGSVQRRSQVRKAKAAKNGGGGGTRSSGVCTVRFYANDKPKADSAQKLFCLAYDHTAGVDPDKPKRVSGADLRAMLAAAGIAEPETTEWEFTLPNGVRIGAKLA